jgi:hypothetical protein
MKRNKAFVVVALALGIFFLLQFAAEFYFSLGKGLAPEKRFAKMHLSMKLFPFTSGFFNEAGFQLLEAAKVDQNSVKVKKSVDYFKAALEKNPLDYQSRYYLAKAYLRLSSDSPDAFDMAIAELTRAARLRGSNKQIAIDCSRVFFSIWPLLEKPDQEFAANLLSEAMPLLSWAEFSPLLEMWSLYIQDSPLLMELLKRKPEFFGPTANQLVSSGIPMAQRHELLDLYEIHILDALERRFNELNLQGMISFEAARSMLKQTRHIKGYHGLQPGSKFKEEKLAKFKRFLYLEVIAGLLSDPKAQADPKAGLQVNDLIQAYIQDHSGLNDLDALQQILEENKFFKSNNFTSLYLKTLLSLKRGNYSDIIAEIEALRKTISFIKKEQLVDYTNILLLLVDSYYSSKLMTAAENVANELYQNQPDNPDVLYRVLRVQKILGTEGPTDKVLNAKLAKIENSRFLTVAHPNSGFDVFLFNQPEIEFVLDPALRARLKAGQLLQVFVDGKIAFESYADAVPEKIAIGPPFTDVERKVRVQVNVI